MRLVIRDTNGVPPERWSYPVAATGVVVEAGSWNSLYSAIEEHCRGNGVPAPGLQEVIDWVCGNLHVPCYEDQTRVALVNKFSLGLPVAPTSCCGKRA